MNEELAKKSLLKQIETAKKAHILWIKKVEDLVHSTDKCICNNQDETLENNFISPKSTSCKFTKWFYSNYKSLRKNPSLRLCVNKIDEQHRHIHKTYKYIYDIFFKPSKKPKIIQKISFLNHKKISEIEKSKAQIYLTYLKHSSSELLNDLAQIEKKLYTLSDEEISKIVNLQRY